uniref:Uncharacterized protein n=1 Tax=Arundo donax TaxID=35708 RepID=A0A0A9GTK9_ARUDO
MSARTPAPGRGGGGAAAWAQGTPRSSRSRCGPWRRRRRPRG